jgi:hypothetical protein
MGANRFLKQVFLSEATSVSAKNMPAAGDAYAIEGKAWRN